MSTGTAEVRVTAAGAEETIADLNRVTEAAQRAETALRGVSVKREPLTYDAEVVERRRGGVQVRSAVPGRSYFQDLYSFRRHGDRDAEERLQQHGKEMRVELPRALNLPPGVEIGVEQRAPTSSYAAPPLWLIQYFAIAPRPERVLADLAPNFDLPQGAFSVSVPRETQASSEGEEQLGADVPDVDDTDAAVTSPVATISGQWDVPLQMLEQSPQGAHFDWVAFTQLQADYDYQLEYQLINGSGAGNQLLGILNNAAIPSGHAVSTTQTTATGQFNYLGQVIAQVGNDRLLAPEVWLLRTNRFAWYGSQEDSQNRPLMITDRDENGKADLLAVSVEQDNAIPTTLGAGTNQDVVIACRPSDWLLLESDLHTDVMEDVLSGSLMVRLQLRGYAAALLRQPTSVAYLTGTGMVKPSGF